MDDFLILLQAKLDEAKSKGNINSDIDKIQGQIDKLKIQAEIDPKIISNLVKQLEGVLNQKINISNIGINANQISKAGQKVGQYFNNGLSQGLNRSSNILNNFKKSLQNIGMGSEEIDAVANKINNLGVQIESLNQTRVTGKSDILSVNISGIDEFGQAIKLAQQYNITTGELIKTIDAVSTAQEKVGVSANSLQRAENIFADYTAKIEQFKSTNSNILSGLSVPLAEFENKLSGLKNGSSTINDVVNSYKNLNAEASKITSNLSAQFNKVDSAVRNIAKGIETIASLKADFKGLSNAPKEVNSELTKCEKLLQKVKSIELQEGRTENWSSAYKEWESSLDILRAKLSTLKKEQSNVASTQVFNTEDLDRQGKVYLQKISNTIEKTKSELESKLRNAGYTDIEIKGVEDAKGKIKSLTATVTDATGAFKQLNFERAKIQGSGKAQAGFIQTDDVKVIGNISSAIDKVQNNLSSLKSKWEEQGILVGEFKDKVDQLETSLNSVGSKNELNGLKAQIQELKSEAATIAQVKEIQLSMTDKSAPKDNYELQVKKLIDQLKSLGLTDEEVAQKTEVLTVAHAKLKEVIESTNFDSVDSKNQAILEADEKRAVAINQVKNAYEEAKLSYDRFMQPVSNEKATSLINRINSFLTKNTKITNEARATLQGYVDELGRGVNLSRWNEINGELKKTENHMRVLGRLGASLKNQMSQAISSFSMWLSASTLVMKFISQTREAVNELKSVDTYLTEISKTNHSLTQSDLEQIGNRSFDIASKYGKAATDYLSGVQDMSRAGYKNAEAMAEVSTAAQGAGDMTAEVANKMVIATDKAYKLGGSVEELTKILDGVNWVCDNNAVNMSELSEGMSIVASTAASLGVDINELTAVLGTMAATTQQSGSEVARAFKAILLNIRQISDEEEGIDAEGLTKYEKACNALGVSLKETKDGILQTRDAMEVLKELSEEYNKLDSNDIRRTDLLNSVGGKLRSTQLDALLRQWDTYENMLKQFSEGSGTMALEAEKTAQSWEGSLKRLHNTWVDTVGNIVNSNFVISITNGFNDFLAVINAVTNKLGALGTIGFGGLGVGITSFVKNFA